MLKRRTWIFAFPKLTIVAHIDTVIVDLDALLLDHLDFRLPQLVGKRVLVYLFQKSRTQFIGHPEATADD